MSQSTMMPITWISRRTRFLLSIVAVAFAMTLAPAPVAAQTPITIDILRDIRFQDFASDVAITGTVTISTTGVKTVTGGVVDFGGNTRAGRFRINGDAQAFVIVTMPSAVTAVNDSNPSHTMTLNNFTLSLTNPIKIANSGRKTVDFGATMLVGANQAPGNYTANIIINVEYL